MPFYSDREYDRLMDLVWKDGKSFNTPEMPEESKQAYQEILDKFGPAVELKQDDFGPYFEEED